MATKTNNLQVRNSADAISEAGPHASSDSSATHSYQLRVQKRALYNTCEEEESADSDTGASDDTVTGRQTKRSSAQLPVDSPDHPRLLPKELDILILYKVYYTIALIPYWVKSWESAATSQTKRRKSLLLESTTTLSKVAHFLTLLVIEVEDLTELDSLILKYRQYLQDGWPSAPSKPNLHLTQHFLEVIRRFGPPWSTAAWAQERVNRMLQRLPTNHHLTEIPKTLVNKWHITSNLRSIQHDTPYVLSNLSEAELEEERLALIQLDKPLYLKWQHAVAHQERAGSTPVAQSHWHLDATIATLRSVQVNRKTFTPKQQHEGNCLVKFYHCKIQRFGEIQVIFQSTQTPGKTWLAVMPFKELQRSEDPYGDYPDLNC
ncbi:hypothetical protein PTTG_29722 [Puccinia triticina 1-1 BBBD Race 1]|uniref:Uncharacterized protein n=1 Tax=Puccinia triticina (isolate 1-1 / race 1 (BBBD)) TaxID=630390 RepID=A0A180G2Y8_PUCT1|nr:hypothetical protein PTTG_29722 [Puccinia triticina 1-1 BBBD Race 1]